MTQIICNWLNEDLQISEFIDQNNFAISFSNGYLIGEILKKYDLMDNFDKLSNKSSAEAKLNNFILLEPILKLLGINFNNSIAKEVMEAKFSTIVNIMYKLFISLENKKKSKTTALSIQTMRAPAINHIQELESVLYQQRLKKITPRQTDMDLHDLIKKYQDHHFSMQLKAEKDRILSAEGHKNDTEKHRQNCLNRLRYLRNQQTEKMKKIESAEVQILKQPPNKTIEAITQQKKERLEKEAKIALQELDNFDRKLRNTGDINDKEEMLGVNKDEYLSISDGELNDGTFILDRKPNKEAVDILDYIVLKDDKEYVNRIRTRLKNDKEARIAREKRRRKVLINCLKSQYQQEENERDTMIAVRLMRQSQMERRIAVQLLQVRHEKNIIKFNRLEREQQYQERREKEFINALEKERELIRQAKLVNMDNLKAEQELYDMKKAQNKLMKYRKHYETCLKIVNDIVDLSCKTSKMKHITDGKIPPKMIREWKISFFNGLPIYDEPAMLEKAVDDSKHDEVKDINIQGVSVPLRPDTSQELDKNEMERKTQILDEEDFMEYKQLIGEWQIEDDNVVIVDRQNNILSWIVQRLQLLSNLVDENIKLPILPTFPIKVAVLGKCFSGKTMLIKNLVKNNRCVSIVPQELIDDALTAFENNETVEVECPANPKFEGSLTINSKIDEDKTENQVSNENLNAGLNEADCSMVNDESMINKAVKQAEEVIIITKQPSRRAELGEKIKEDLINGKSVNDQLLVDCIIEYIQRIPEGTGWIIDDFPTTYQQAKLFEKSFTGYEEPNLRLNRKKGVKQIIPKVQSGLDALILLDVNDSDCLARAMSCSENLLNKKSEISNNTKNVIANLQMSLTNFADHWPKLSKFYNRISDKLIKTIDSSNDVSSSQVYLKVETLLDDIVKKKEEPESFVEPILSQAIEVEPPTDQGIITDLKSEIDLDAVSNEVILSKLSTDRKSKPSSRASSAKSKSSDKKPSSRKSRSKSKTESINSKVDKKVSSKEAPKKKDSKPNNRKGSKGSKTSKTSSKGSRSGSGKNKKSKTTAPAETEKTETISVPEVTEPQPGDVDWVYCNKPLNQELSLAFIEFWDSLNGIYAENCKTIFREIRSDREEILCYLHAIKTAFRKFLDRPDAKQEYLDQFQKDFNEIAEEWRDDDEVQQELHQRISELRDQLLEISHENQVEAEKEMEKLKTNHWIEDHVGLVTNQYLNLIQCEFDRFQDVIRFLRDYYKSMNTSQLDEFKAEFLRLPLIEIPVPKDEPAETIDLSTDNKTAITNTTVSPTIKKPAAKATIKAPVSENQPVEEMKELTPEDLEALFKIRIPLIEFKTSVAQITSAALTSASSSRKPAKGDKLGSSIGIAKFLVGGKSDKKTEKQSDSQVIPSDLDERLLFDALQSCYSLANAMLELETSSIDQKEEAEKLAPTAVTDKGKTDKGKADKGKADKKGKKSRTPTPKKEAKDKTATNTSDVEESEEDKQNRLFLEKAKLEYIASLQKEISILKVNVKVIMSKGCDVIKDLKNKVDMAFQIFSTWIADKLLQEDLSVKQIEKVYRYHIESKKPLQEKVELINHKFYLNPDIEPKKKLQSIDWQSSVEAGNEIYFSIDQLHSFYSLFQSITNGEDVLISIIDFIQLIHESLVATDQKLLPNFITQSSHLEANITLIAETFSCDKEYVNWRLFLLSCSEPWPWPTQKDLLYMLEKFKELDQQNSGFVTREQYEFIDLWFPIPIISSSPSTPCDIVTFKGVNRLLEIKKFFFNVFKISKSQERSMGLEYLNYEDMLLHFAIFCTNNFYSGIIRALSIVIGENLPHTPIFIKDLDITVDEDMDDARKTDNDVPIPIEKLYKVLSFGHRKTLSFDEQLKCADLEDSECERDTTLIKSLKNIYETIEENDNSTVTFSCLMMHEGLHEWLLTCQWFKHGDLRSFFGNSNDSFRASGD